MLLTMWFVKSNCSKDFHLNVEEIDESVLNKIENLYKDNNTKLLIKKCFEKNYQNKERKRRDIYNNKLDKLKKRYENEMRNENDYFPNIEPV